ncbi:hypothetical protein B0T11DRAFT_282229 [Plectosphaerella cucumerina]|uniref:C2H2-type domain-containing protein n=1 Tax=Plectosphaerella cucumerina TaxID=40658 RepID=A0A8K0TKI5_9PEZI|nr:hypothetical protein B0T11DRAFT_282229 [Plectosphaerella cucumerina]
MGHTRAFEVYDFNQALPDEYLDSSLGIETLLIPDFQHNSAPMCAVETNEPAVVDPSQLSIMPLAKDGYDCRGRGCQSHDALNSLLSEITVSKGETRQNVKSSPDSPDEGISRTLSGENLCDTFDTPTSSPNNVERRRKKQKHSKEEPRVVDLTTTHLDKPPEIDQPNHGASGAEDNRLLACPFFRHDPLRNMECMNMRLSRSNDVKQHLRRRHYQTTLSCPMCCQEFATEERFGDHVRSGTCTRKNSETSLTVQKIPLKTQTELKRPPVRHLHRKDQWDAIYNTIFPQDKNPGSPYLDSALGEVIGIVRLFWSQNGSKFAASFLNMRQDSLMEVNSLLSLVTDLLRHIQDNIQKEEDGDDSHTNRPQSTEPTDIKRQQVSGDDLTLMDDSDGKFDSPLSNHSGPGSWFAPSLFDCGHPNFPFDQHFTLPADFEFTDEPFMLPGNWPELDELAVTDTCPAAHAKSHELPHRAWAQTTGPRAFKTKGKRQELHSTKLPILPNASRRKIEKPEH